MTDFYPRYAAEMVTTALRDSRVVFVAGPRQAGKSTLVKSLGGDARPYFTLDDEVARSAAIADPKGFIRGLDAATIDEIQRAPDLMLAIKESVDTDKRPGRFLLTGSANVMTRPKVADSLAGRIETILLMPLARSEIVGNKNVLIEHAFQGAVPSMRGTPVTGDALIEIVLAGGYPEAISRASAPRRVKWYLDYVEALIQKDVRDIAEVHHLGSMPKLLRLLAQHSAQLVNYSGLGAPLGLDLKTVRRYVDIFSALYLLRTVPPWYSNQINRLTKSPKLHFLDSGLLAAIQGMTIEKAKADRGAFGHVLESFVYSEILKQASWMATDDLLIHHFRTTTHSPEEVDFVLENRHGRIVGIEVKASATVTAADFRGLRRLAETARERFVTGLVLYDGDKTVPFGSGLYAVPISALWG